MKFSFTLSLPWWLLPRKLKADLDQRVRVFGWAGRSWLGGVITLFASKGG